MTIDEIKKWMLESSGFPVTQANAEYLERFQTIAFKAGAASRDAYIEQLELALLQVRKAICGDIHNTDDLLDLIPSRDAEIQRLQFALADAEALELGTAERCDQLRAHINDLREALTHSDTLLRYLPNSGGFYGIGVMENNAEALASIPEQSLAEYRNKVIEECACIFGGPNTPVSNEEAEAWRNPPAAIRALKEQP